MSRPNVFVIGHSKIGKSPLALSLAAQLELRLVPASAWVRRRYEAPAAIKDDPQKVVEDITVYSCAELARDPDVCVDYIRATEPVAAGGCVVEGIRNPRDFALLFRPERDIVLFLFHEASAVRPTLFEAEGTRIIDQTVDWLVANGMTAKERVLRFRLGAIRGTDTAPTPDDLKNIPGPQDALPMATLDETMATATETLRRLYRVAAEVEQPSAARPRKGVAHVEIAPFAALIEERVLQDENEAFAGKWLPCTVFAVSSYPGEALAFEVMLPNGAMFSYVPAHRLRHDLGAFAFRAAAAPADDAESVAAPEPAAPLGLKDLVYHDCRDAAVAVTAYATLARHPCRAYIRPQPAATGGEKPAGRWYQARYAFTVDWYVGNDLLHCVFLENGQIALLPSHKIIFDGKDTAELPPYKKLHATWRVED